MDPDPSPRRSPFHERQEAWHARFAEDAGWIVAESFPGEPGRAAARERAALLDLSPLGRIKVTGKDRVDLLQRISTNDMKALAPGRFLPTLFVTPKGRIVGRAHVFDRGDSLLLLTAQEIRESLTAWIRKYVLASDFQLTDLSTETSAFAIIGPMAAHLIKELVGIGVGSLAPDRFLDVAVAGVETLVAPYDALPASWIFIAERPGVLTVYDQAFALGAARGILPIGAEDAEVLRVEAGLPRHGRELTEDWNPWEARLEGSFSLSKGCYTGQEVIARLNTYDKVQRRLVGLRMGAVEPPAAPQTVYAVTAGSEREAGTLTSSVWSDALGEAIGLAFVRVGVGEPDAEVLVGDQRTPARVGPPPFH